MRTARLHGAGDLRLHDEPEPVPAPGEVLLRVTAAGLCGSDRHWFRDGSIGGTGLARPLVLGHEIAAEIVAGPDAGTRVAVEPAVPCERCPTCRGGQGELCPTARFAGYGATDGGLRTTMSWPRHLLRPVPDVISDAEVAVLEALGVALHAVSLADVDMASRVAVVGCGPVGLLTIRALVAAGVRSVVAVEPLAHRATAAVAAGARPAVATDEVDVAIECAGTDAAVDTAIGLARPGGRVVLVGIPGSDRTVFTASVARRKGLTLILCRRMRPDDLGRAIDLVAAGVVDVGAVISHRFALDDVGSAFRILDQQVGHKVVVLPAGGSA